MTYADVDRKGGGVVHFSNRDDMEYALRKMDGSEFANRYDSAAISVSIGCDSVIGVSGGCLVCCMVAHVLEGTACVGGQFGGQY